MRLLKKAQNLLAQLCVQYPTEGVVFELSAKLLDKEPLQKAQKLQKGHRAYTQVPIRKYTLIVVVVFVTIYSFHRDKMRGQKLRRVRFKY